MKNYFKCKFLGKNKKLVFGIGKYATNGNLYLGLYEPDGELFSDISCNYWALGQNEIELDHNFLDICPEIFERLKVEWILIDRNIYWRVNLDKVREYEYWGE